MAKHDEIAKIYDQKLSQLRDPAEWKNTMRLTSNFWRLDFCAAMLLVVQNPQAQMCGTLAQWNNVGRYVRRGEHSTVVFHERTDTQLLYLFDVRQTYGTPYNAKWKLSERMADGIVGKFNSEQSENAVSFEDFLQKSLDKNIDIVYNYDSKLNKSISSDPRVALFIRRSAEYICMARCGLDSEPDFSEAARFRSDLSIIEMGNAATALAQEVLRDIDQTIRRKDYERYEAGVCGRHLRYPLRGEGRTVSPDIRELRQERHDTAGNQGSGLPERDRPNSAGYGEHQRSVPENLEADRQESGERPHLDPELSHKEAPEQPEIHGESADHDRNRAGGAEFGMGNDTVERDMAGGGSPEPWEADGDSEDFDEYDEQELTDEVASDEEPDAISVFSDIPDEIDPRTEFAQKLLEDEILHGSHSAGGKFRITEYISDNSPTNDELAKFLKNEYGIGGGSRSGIVKFSNHDGKGLELILENNGNRQTVRFGWKVVAKAIRKAVDEGRYITEKDIETARRYTQFDAEHFAIHYEYPYCFENSRLKSIRKDIERTGLDIQIRLTPDLFAIYAEEYIRSQPHVKEEYQNIERSSVNAPFRFNDWSAAAEAARTLTSESGYTEFRSICRDSVSELVTQLANPTGHNPGLGFPEEEITEFLNSGEISEDKWTDEITAQVFGYLYNRERSDIEWKRHSEAKSQPEQPAEQLSLFGNDFEISDNKTAELAGRIDKYDLDLDFTKISEVEIEERSAIYLGGIDENGHERKDNFDEEINTVSFYAAPDNSALLTLDESDGIETEISLSEALKRISVYIDLSGHDEKFSVFIKSLDGKRQYVDSGITHNEADPNELAQARASINEYCEREFGDEADFSDLNRVDLAFTTDENEEYTIDVYADLVQYRIVTELGGVAVREEQYDSLKEMTENALNNLTFDDLTYISEDERRMFEEVPHGEAPHEEAAQVPHDAAPPNESPLPHRAAPAKGNYHFSENFAYPNGPKAKYFANVTAIKTLKQIESEHRHAIAEEQEILAHYSGWGGIADAFDSSKENWSREYAELKDLLTDKEYTAARESTLTAFYTEPYIIKSIYMALGNMGFSGGDILDPSMGTGNFFGNLPPEMAQNSRLYGVELDSLTARIAKELYPQAEIQHKGFERTHFENGRFDVIVGNVPFGDFTPYDPEYSDYLIHDYFFAKCADKLKPGGIMALITSSGTMDKRESDLRSELAEKARLLGAIRLPEDAFRTAGTQTVTDILFFQKLEPGEQVLSEDWVNSKRIYGTGFTYCENPYFTEHPEMVLGTAETVSGRYGYTRTIKSDGSTAERLSDAVSRLEGRFTAEPTVDDELPPEENISIPNGAQPYTFYTENNALYYAENRSAKPYSGKDSERIKSMCVVLDRLNDVTAAQKKGCSDDELKSLQSRLNSTYDGFVKRYGNINSRTNTAAFGDDVRFPRLAAIENVEDIPGGGQRVTKADVFTQRTINIDRLPTHADTALEALHLSMNLRQTVDLDYMSELCGKEKDDIIEELGDRIFCNPAKNTGGRYSGWEIAEEYLSGHVRSKLALAQEVAKSDPDFERNVTALLENQPPRVNIGDIGFRLGTIYIPAEMFQQFIYDTFQTPEWLRRKSNGIYSKDIFVAYSPEMNIWKVKNASGMSDVLSTQTFGTKRANAYELTELLLNQKRAAIYDYRENADGKKERIFNTKETILARSCQDKIEQAFHEWVMSDHDRITTIEDIFNSLYNNIKPRTYNGDYITIPGMNPNLSLRPHQKNVIARIAATGTCMMAHEVGAGKTAAMAAAGMYLKSIGACNKPMYVVPNAVVAQFGEEFQRFFPEARILVATSKDMEKSQRRRFLSKISVGNYDAIIIPQSQFEKMPLSLARQEAMYDDKLTEITNAINLAKAEKGERFTIKALERQRKSITQKIEKMRAAFKKDDFITFEELGCDFLFVDEAHNYKNLAVFSKMNNVAGVNANQNSQKSFDMEMKCRYLQELNHGGGVVFATGTPISNSITELFVWQYLLQKQTLDDMNISYFDNWASVYGVVTQSIEVKPSGAERTQRNIRKSHCKAIPNQSIIPTNL